MKVCGFGHIQIAFTVTDHKLVLLLQRADSHVSPRPVDRCFSFKYFVCFTPKHFITVGGGGGGSTMSSGCRYMKMEDRETPPLPPFSCQCAWSTKQSAYISHEAKGAGKLEAASSHWLQLDLISYLQNFTCWCSVSPCSSFSNRREVCRDVNIYTYVCAACDRPPTLLFLKGGGAFVSVWVRWMPSACQSNSTNLCM